MKEIRLTHGHVALVDDCDYEVISKYKWHAQKSANTYYARTTVINDGVPSKVLMHRMINKTKQTQVCDHRDGNGLNNIRSNIRNCSRAENGRNVRPLEGVSSKFKGVYYHKDTGKWVARITVGGKVKYLGLFSSEVDAALTYNAEAKKLHGAFARLNLIA